MIRTTVYKVPSEETLDPLDKSFYIWSKINNQN